MVPLIEMTELLRRKPKDVIRTFYLLYEGQNTEVSLINPMIANTPLFKNSPIRFQYLSKTENDIGRTQPLAMIKIAKEFIEAHCGSKGDFVCGRDKVLIVFDLDITKNDQKAMDEILARKTSDMILCYTNPAIELFLLLARKHSYETIIEPRKKEILDNEWVGDERYVLNLFKKEFGIDPKSRDVDFRFILDNIEIAAQQENLFLNRKISKAANNLTSNIAHVLLKIRDNKIDEIEY